MTDYIPLLETYVARYKKDEKLFVDMIGSLDVPKQVVSSLYEMFVRRKEIEPIETIPEEYKRRLWNTAKTYSSSKKDALMICKAIYLIENITHAN